MSDSTPISRRTLLRRISAGAAAAVAAPSLARTSLGATTSEGPLRLHRNEAAYGPPRRAIAGMQEADVNGASR